MTRAGRSVLRAFTVLSLLVALPAALASAARAEPAMWVVRDADSTIYLFGTVHVLKPGAAWSTARLEQAFAACKDLTLEIADADDLAAMAPLILKYGFDPSHSLFDSLDSAGRKRLSAAAASLGVAEAQIAPMRPWLAGLTLTLAPVVRAGYDPNAGVERRLMNQAKARSEPVLGMETLEDQVRLLSELPKDVQMALLRESLDEFDKGAAELDRLAAAWAAGRVNEIDRAVNEGMRRHSPELYRRLLADRNTAFAARIKVMLDRAGTRCVAVGAGHLAGADSVQAKLKVIGVDSARY